MGRVKKTESESEKTWWQIDYSSDIVLGLLLMTAVLGSRVSNSAPAAELE